MFTNYKYDIPQGHLDGAAAARKGIEAARLHLDRITVSDGHKELVDTATAYAAIAQAEATLLLAGQQREANDLTRVIELIRLSVWAADHKYSSGLMLGDATIMNPVPEGKRIPARWLSGLQPDVRELFDRTLCPKPGSPAPSNLQEMPSPWDVEPK